LEEDMFTWENAKLAKFIKSRKELNAMFDLLHEKWFEEFLAEVDEFKNLILKAWFVTLQQLSMLEDGRLIKGVMVAISLVKEHLKECTLWRVTSVQWGQCQDVDKPIMQINYSTYQKWDKCREIFHPNWFPKHAWQNE
jgi:hypothetical protein